MLAAGELPVIRIGRSVRVPRAALERWVAEHTQDASSGTQDAGSLLTGSEDRDASSACIWLLDHGRIEEGLGLYSIELDRELVLLLRGQPIHYQLKGLTGCG